MASSIVFINQKGDILIYRRFRDDVSRQETMNFCNKIVATKEAKEQPISHIDYVSYIHTTQEGITLLATTTSNANAALLMQFLYQLVIICKSYFGGKFDENQIRKNFVLIYELLDEIMDYGYPQITEPEVLKLYITQGSYNPTLLNAEKLRAVTIQATGAISWRAENIKYRKNEVYIDAIEFVNVLLSTRGIVLKADALGKVVVKTQLSGMPECKFGINDKLVLRGASTTTTTTGAGAKSRGISIDDIKFHQCVRLGKFDIDRSITFVPPDGTFELMSYHITQHINLPFKVTPMYMESPNKSIEANIHIKSIFERNSFASNVVMKIPLPKNALQVKCMTSSGKAKYEPENGGVLWRIKKFPGETEYRLQMECKLTPSQKPWQRPPISLDFQVPMFTASGMRVRYLKIVEKSGYEPTKWIRYITKSGSYEHRI